MGLFHKTSDKLETQAPKVPKVLPFVSGMTDREFLEEMDHRPDQLVQAVTATLHDTYPERGITYADVMGALKARAVSVRRDVVGTQPTPSVPAAQPIVTTSNNTKPLPQNAGPGPTIRIAGTRKDKVACLMLENVSQLSFAVRVGASRPDVMLMPGDTLSISNESEEGDLWPLPNDKDMAMVPQDVLTGMMRAVEMIAESLGKSVDSTLAALMKEPMR